ncbi:phage major capsid protein [Neptunicoccus sediminis]|uniref:phage major capsid protein n=1 Tax=Neptunicoccus sediminis TaxID=1892596 RepID=UPI0008461BB5|nr:phage major capsid protein [Neptunicoccus sediminis]
MEIETQIKEMLDEKFAGVVKEDALEAFVKSDVFENFKKELEAEKATVQEIKTELESAIAKFEAAPVINKEENLMEDITLSKAFDDVEENGKAGVAIETKALNQAQNVTGAPSQTFGVASGLHEDNPFRLLARKEITTATTAKVPFFAGGASGFTKNGATRGTANTSTDSTITEKTVSIGSYDRLEYVSNETISDIVNFDASMINQILGLAVETEAAEHVTTIEAVASPVVADAAAAITLDDLREMVFGLSEKYRKNAVIVMSTGAYSQLHTLTASTGSELVWDAKEGVYKLWGRPIVENSFMADPAAGEVVAAIADWNRAMVIVDRETIELERNTATPGKVGYYANYRTGHAMLDSNAIKTLKMAAA